MCPGLTELSLTLSFPSRLAIWRLFVPCAQDLERIIKANFRRFRSLGTPEESPNPRHQVPLPSAPPATPTESPSHSSGHSRRRSSRMRGANITPIPPTTLDQVLDDTMALTRTMAEQLSLFESTSVTESHGIRVIATATTALDQQQQQQQQQQQEIQQSGAVQPPPPYFFFYTIRVENRNRRASVQLMGRHWIIQDEQGRETDSVPKGSIGRYRGRGRDGPWGGKTMLDSWSSSWRPLPTQDEVSLALTCTMWRWKQGPYPCASSPPPYMPVGKFATDLIRKLSVASTSRYWNPHVPHTSPLCPDTGVVGHEPILRPGQKVAYMSGAKLPTPYGSMQGSFQMVKRGGEGSSVPDKFDARVSPFLLKQT